MYGRTHNMQIALAAHGVAIHTLVLVPNKTYVGCIQYSYMCSLQTVRNITWIILSKKIQIPVLLAFN